jgi:outer membrane protein assembly factor BamB
MVADSQHLFYVVEKTKPSPGHALAYLVALDAKTGRQKWQRESSARLGAPVVKSGKVFVPLQRQAIAILDGNRGAEEARLRARDDTLLWVRSSEEGLLYGGNKGIYWMDRQAASGLRRQSSYLPLDIPSTMKPRPIAWWDGYNTALSNYTAYDRNRLLWQAAPTKKNFLKDTVFIHHYRFFFALDSTATKNNSLPKLRWAYSYPRHDIVASTFTGDNLLLITAHGHLLVLDPRNGYPLLEKALKMRVKGAAFDVQGYKLTAATAHPPRKIDLRQSLKTVIWDPDRRFSDIKLFCVNELAALKDKKVPADLVEILTDEKISPAVYQAASEALVARHDQQAIPLYLKVLKKNHYSFLRSTQAKAVDVMARALADLKAPEAVKPLLLHLADHETPLAVLVEIIKALTVIGDISIIEPLKDFLLTYRCDPLFLEAPDVLNLAGEALFKLGGEEEKQLLSFIQNDPHTLDALQFHLGSIFRQRATSAVKTPELESSPSSGPQSSPTPAPATPSSSNPKQKK